MPKAPNTIFKYEGFTTQTLLNLKAQSVYFASPRQFNDPYDCAITTSIAEPTFEQVQRVLNFYVDDPEVSTLIKSQLRAQTPEQLKVMFVRSANDVLTNARDTFFKKSGVSCFSERNDDLLMWSHYGGRYKGICLEFRTEFEPFQKLRRVNYVSEIPSVRIDTLIVDKEVDQVIDNLFCTKAKAWSYEQEWRGLHKEAATLYTYEARALKAIYFGPDVESLSLDIICLILQSQNLEVEFWRGHRSKTKFEVEFDRFTYTSFIEAKRLGLK